MKNRAFCRALHGLAHDVSCGAILLLLLNDHLFRVFFPSWLTGKLGDFAWLVFAPFICALACAGLFRGRRQEQIVGVVSFAFIGIWFATAKTVPLINRWTAEALAWLLGYRGAIRLDSTDLLVLPALAIGWAVWRSVDNRAESLKPRSWTLIALGVMATVATSGGRPEWPRGIARLCQDGADLYAFEKPFYRGVHSIDGGKTWRTLSANGAAKGVRACGKTEVRDAVGRTSIVFSNSPFQVSMALDDGSRRYRIVHGPEREVETRPDYDSERSRGQSGEFRAIETSGDGGKTWMQEFDLSDLATQLRRAAYTHAFQAESSYGPLDGLVTVEGNILLAMGTDGVLLRTPDGDWNWIQAGGYQHETFGFTRRLIFLLWQYPPWTFVPGSLFPAVVFAGLAFLTIGRMPHVARLWYRLLAFTTWLLLAAMCLHDSFLGGLAGLGWQALFPVEAILIVLTGRRLRVLDAGALRVVALLAAVSGVLYFFPFLFWAIETIPYYGLVQLYGFVLGAAAVVSSRLYVCRRYRRIFRPYTEGLASLT